MGIFGFNRPRNVTREVKITTPDPHPNRNGIAIVACVRNEISYIVEWLRFHQAVGVRHFILYNDRSSDGTFELLEKIMSPSELTVIPWSMRMHLGSADEVLNGQVIAFAHAISNFGGQFERMAFIDVDEFLLPKSGRTLQEALAASDGFPNISLPWHMFGHSGHETRPSLSVTQAYTQRVPDPSKRHQHASNFKCIVDPTQVTRVAVHHFHTKNYGDETCNDAGKRATYRSRKQADFYSAKHIQLNHYYTKSREEFQNKIARGWTYDFAAEKYREKALSIQAYVEEAPVQDTSMRDYLLVTDVHVT